jgi:hypothetical protein
MCSYLDEDPTRIVMCFVEQKEGRRIGGLDLWCSVSHQSDRIGYLIQPMLLALDAMTRQLMSSLYIWRRLHVEQVEGGNASGRWKNSSFCDVVPSRYGETKSCVGCL